MKKMIMVLIALLLTASCAGVQESKAPVAPTVSYAAPVVQAQGNTATPPAQAVKLPNYTGTWTGLVVSQSEYVNGDQFTMSLNHNGDKITGTFSDSMGYMSNTEMTDMDLKGNVLKFSVIAMSSQGNYPVYFSGTFSGDNREYALSFEVGSAQIDGTATMKKS